MVHGRLHQLIEQQQWDVALQSLLTDSSVRAECRATHKDDLPLHMACDRRAPDDVLLEILRCNTGAAKWTGQGGSMPLHIATHRNLSPEIVEAIIRANPDALDARNAANYTPRDYGHSDPGAFQLLNRPTSCWHQLLHDEAKEQEQDRKLQTLHAQIDTSLAQLQRNSDSFDDMVTRLEHVETKLREFEELQAQDLESTVNNMEKSIRATMEQIENRLSTVEDDVRAAAARDYMARAASRAHQCDVIKMQEASAEEARRLRKELEEFRIKMMDDKNTSGPVNSSITNAVDAAPSSIPAEGPPSFPTNTNKDTSSLTMATPKSPVSSPTNLHPQSNPNPASISTDPASGPPNPPSNPTNPDPVSGPPDPATSPNNPDPATSPTSSNPRSSLAVNSATSVYTPASFTAQTLEEVKAAALSARDYIVQAATTVTSPPQPQPTPTSPTTSRRSSPRVNAAGTTSPPETTATVTTAVSPPPPPAPAAEQKQPLKSHTPDRVAAAIKEVQEKAKKKSTTPTNTTATTTRGRKNTAAGLGARRATSPKPEDIARGRRAPDGKIGPRSITTKRSVGGVGKKSSPKTKNDLIEEMRKSKGDMIDEIRNDEPNDMGVEVDVNELSAVARSAPKPLFP